VIAHITREDNRHRNLIPGKESARDTRKRVSQQPRVLNPPPPELLYERTYFSLAPVVIEIIRRATAISFQRAQIAAKHIKLLRNWQRLAHTPPSMHREKGLA